MEVANEHYQRDYFCIGIDESGNEISGEEFERSDVFTYLLNQGADFRDGINRNSYLHWAAQTGNIKVISLLISHNADINAKDKYYRTPLHYAAENGHLSVVEYLVNQKADINTKTKNVEFLYLIRLLSIMLLKKVILVLLNI